jgi:hypothetical protein
MCHMCRFLPPELCRFVLHIEDNISVQRKNELFVPLQQIAASVNDNVQKATAVGRKLLFKAATTTL